MNSERGLHKILVIVNYADVFRGDFFWWWWGKEGLYVGGFFHEGGLHGERDISMKGVPDLPVLFKKRSEIK